MQGPGYMSTEAASKYDHKQAYPAVDGPAVAGTASGFTSNAEGNPVTRAPKTPLTGIVRAVHLACMLMRYRPMRTSRRLSGRTRIGRLCCCRCVAAVHARW